ncbi:MAG: hypothetical protein K1X40_09090, partial [Chitinophagales bacterium]|nr:hypothetical protein [Chitinophagales bacterium]
EEQPFVFEQVLVNRAKGIHAGAKLYITQKGFPLIEHLFLFTTYPIFAAPTKNRSLYVKQYPAANQRRGVYHHA